MKILIAVLLCALPAMSKSAFTQKKIALSGKILTVEIADNDKLRGLGVMHREVLAKDSGMLFIFPRQKVLSFWMKNTFLSLDLIFISEVLWPMPRQDSLSFQFSKV